MVTALFADISDSTGIAERLDPEDARELVGEAIRAICEVIEG